MMQQDKELITLGFKDLVRRLGGWREFYIDRSQMFEYLIIWGKFIFKICSDFDDQEIRSLCWKLLSDIGNILGRPPTRNYYQECFPGSHAHSFNPGWDCYNIIQELGLFFEIFKIHELPTQGSLFKNAFERVPEIFRKVHTLSKLNGYLACEGFLTFSIFLTIEKSDHSYLTIAKKCVEKCQSYINKILDKIEDFSEEMKEGKAYYLLSRLALINRKLYPKKEDVSKNLINKIIGDLERFTKFTQLPLILLDIKDMLINDKYQILLRHLEKLIKGIEFNRLEWKTRPNLVLSKYLLLLKKDKHQLSEKIKDILIQIIHPHIKTNRKFIIETMIKCIYQLQQKIKTIKESEDHYSEYLSSLINNLIDHRKWHIEEQKPSGTSASSGKKKWEKIGGLGELDFVFMDEKNMILTICEAFVLRFNDKKTINNHLLKIFKYDAIGLPFNFIIIYSKVVKFDELWSKYKETVIKVPFKYKLKEKRFYDESDQYDIKSELRMEKTIHIRQGKSMDLYHFLINTSF